MKTLISFRLRKDLDADLISVEMDDEKLKDLCRDGLRLMLGIRTTKKIQVTETALFLPASPHDVNHESPAQQGNEPAHAEPQRTLPRRESLRESSTQQKAARLPEKPAAPFMPNQKHRN
jgi:hypothetical protein